MRRKDKKRFRKQQDCNRCLLSRILCIFHEGLRFCAQAACQIHSPRQRRHLLDLSPML